MYNTFSLLLNEWPLAGIPDPHIHSDFLVLCKYLVKDLGIEIPEEVSPKKLKKRYKIGLSPDERVKVAQRGRSPPGSTWVKSPPKSRRVFLYSLLDFLPGHKRNSSTGSGIDFTAAIEVHTSHELIEETSQSKLSQEQLSELQRSTHFDKKELQQWYKGMFYLSFSYHL